MRIRLRFPDGKETIHEVASAAVLLDEGWAIELHSTQRERRIMLHAPSGITEFPGFIVHHRCANTMDLELVTVPCGPAGNG